MSIQYNTLKGLLFIFFIATLSIYLATLAPFKNFAISPLIIGLLLGTLYGNIFQEKYIEKWKFGILFSGKTILRIGIMLYGFRITLDNIAEVGIPGIVVSVSIVFLTSLVGYTVGVKFLKMDRDTTILITVGSSICGAAAVLGADSVIRADRIKRTIAIAIVVIFGTIGMFLYPFLYQSGMYDFSAQGLGIYIGGTIHEVAHVVAAGHAVNPETANTAIIVKMLRVMMLVPFLIILSLWLKKIINNKVNVTNDIKKEHSVIPWFAVGFILVVLFNSLNLLSPFLKNLINQLDTLALTMAMTSLGIENRFSLYKGVGLKPVYLGGILFLWLMFAGYFITKWSLVL